MRARFIAFTAFRYFRSKRRSSGGTATLLSVLGVGVGVMTLTAVLGVMNGFQLGFIESILEVSSYHLQIEAGGELPEPSLEALRRLPMVRAVVPFTEQQVIVEGRYSGPRGCLIRGLPVDVAGLDRGFSERLEMVEGSFDLSSSMGIVLGAELARHLGIGSGDTVSVLTLGGESFQELQPARRLYVVKGLFKSGYYEFDLGWAFISLAAAAEGGPQAPVRAAAQLRYGVKIANRFRDQAALWAIRSALGEGPYRVGSWREFNRAFFGALRMEKLFMMILIGLIFVVVGFNIYQSLRRSVRERFEEIGVLKALGASDGAVQYIFIAEGLLVGFWGGLLGLGPGLLVAANVNPVFRAAEGAANLLLGLLARALAPLAGAAPGERFSLFSPAYFYISEIPSRVLFPEAFLVVLFALCSCTLAAVFASSGVRMVKPAEILRYE